MSVLLYWQERLDAQNPLYTEKLRINQVNVRPMPGMDPKASWPRAVARSALYEDYVNWHQDQFLLLYKGIEWAGPMPQPAEELIFYATIAPWIYVVGKDQQVRTYMIPFTARYEGEWVETKKMRYFVRLLDWQYHAASFELQTGIFRFFPQKTAEDRVRMIEAARADWIKELAYNRHKMEKSMSGGTIIVGDEAA